MNLTELSKRIRFDNASKGFDPLERGIDRYLLLAISEICEAQEELRDGNDVNRIYYVSSNGRTVVQSNKPNELENKPCGFPTEIADAIIRLLDIRAKFDLVTDIREQKKAVEYDTESYLLVIVDFIARLGLSEYKDRGRAGINDCTQMAIFMLWNMCLDLKIPIEKIIEEKLAYNKTRPPKHGRRF